MIYIGKNIAGKDRFMLTLTGTIVLLLLTWLVGKIVTPPTFFNKKNKMEGVWYYKTNTGFNRLQVKANGYFYFDMVLDKGKTEGYKGMLASKITDTLSAISFNNDTLLFHKIIQLNNKKCIVKSIQNASIICLTKEK